MSDIDFSKVLWSSDRQTDKIFNVFRFSLTIPAGQTQSDGYAVDAIRPDGIYPESGKGNALSYQWTAYFKYGNAWIPCSPIQGSANVLGVAVSYDSNIAGTTFFAFTNGTGPITVDVVVLFMPTSKISFNYGGVDWNTTTGAIVPYNQSPTPKIKWSSFDRQATIAGSAGVVYLADNNPRQLLKIDHTLGKRPTVMFDTCIVFGNPSLLSTLPKFNRVHVYKDSSSIYVDYAPVGSEDSGAQMLVHVWWYNE